MESQNYVNRLSITLDVDWACDGVLSDTLDLIDSCGIPVTIFVTHETPLLARMRRDPLITLGIHPNFLPLLQHSGSAAYDTVLKEMTALVPEAKFIRGHALIDATPILVSAKALGFQADLNLFIPFSSGIPLKPFTHFSGIKRIPFFYEDDAYCWETVPASPEAHLNAPGLKIFNFHPIHLFLNTEIMARYQEAKAYYHDYEALKPFINTSTENGARNFLFRIIRAAKENNFQFDRLETL